MIEIDIPRDIRKYESKLVGPFTPRQTVCVVIGAAIAVGIYQLLKFLPSDTRLMVSATFALPVLLFGWLKPYGMKLEDFLRTAVISNFVAPKHRLYKTQNIYIDTKKTMSPKEKEAKRKSMPKSKQYPAYK